MAKQEIKVDSKGTHDLVSRKSLFEILNWDRMTDRQRENHQRLIDQRRVYTTVGTSDALVYPMTPRYTHVVKGTAGRDMEGPGLCFCPASSFDEAVHTAEVFAQASQERGTETVYHILNLLCFPVGLTEAVDPEEVAKLAKEFDSANS